MSAAPRSSSARTPRHEAAPAVGAEQPISVTTYPEGATNARAVVSRPILFSAPMVLALLAGTKTQTRRIVKAGAGQQRKWLTSDLLAKVPSVTAYPRGINDCGPGVQLAHPGGGPLGFVASPYGGTSDRLWVRETWGYRGRGAHFGGDSDNGATTDVRIQYAADQAKRTIVRPSEGTDEQLPKQRCLPKLKGHDTRGVEHYEKCLTAYWRSWRPSIFMRPWMSRLSLEVTGVRVERLQDISEADAIAEGIERDTRPFVYGWRNYGEVDLPGESLEYFADPRDSYRSLWESINGPGSWAANPWVWVVSFARVVS